MYEVSIRHILLPLRLCKLHKSWISILPTLHYEHFLFMKAFSSIANVREYMITNRCTRLTCSPATTSSIILRNGGCMCPSCGMLIAASALGCVLLGPGPISTRCGTSIGVVTVALASGFIGISLYWSGDYKLCSRKAPIDATGKIRISITCLPGKDKLAGFVSHSRLNL